MLALARAGLQLLLAAALTAGLDWALTPLFRAAFLGLVTTPVLGFVATFVASVLQAALLLLPALLLAVLWLRAWGGAPVPRGAAAVGRCLLSAWWLVLLLVAVATLAGSLGNLGFAVALQAIGQPAAPWIQAGLGYLLGALLQVWFAPAIVRRLAGLPPEQRLAWRSGRHVLVALVLAGLAVLLPRLLGDQLTRALLPSLARHPSLLWAIGAGRDLLLVLATALLYLAAWCRLLRRPAGAADGVAPPAA